MEEGRHRVGHGRGKIAFTLETELCMSPWRKEYPRLGLYSTASEASAGRH